MNGRNGRPLIAVTLGDPGGIGAEVIVKALADDELRRSARFVVFGLHEIMSYAADQAEVMPYWFRIPHDELGAVESGVVVADFDEYALFSPLIKRPTAESGHASMRFLDEALAVVRADRRSSSSASALTMTSAPMPPGSPGK